MSAVDEYLNGLDIPARVAFGRIRDVALAAKAGLRDGRSYGMAALLYRDKPLLGLRAATGHLSVYPFSSQVVDSVRGQLAGFALAKGTIRFTAAHPVPDSVIRDMVRLRVAEIDASLGS